MMHMSFWWGDDLGDFFFKGFQISSPRSMTLLCVTLFFLSVAVEGLKVESTLPQKWLKCLTLCFAIVGAQNQIKSESSQRKVEINLMSAKRECESDSQ
jgi:Ctr copper transporter family